MGLRRQRATGRPLPLVMRLWLDWSWSSATEADRGRIASGSHLKPSMGLVNEAGPSSGTTSQQRSVCAALFDPPAAHRPPLKETARTEATKRHCHCSPPAVSGRPLWLWEGAWGGGGGGGALGPLKGKGTIRGRLREEVPPNDTEHFKNNLSGVPEKSQTSGWEGGDGVSVCGLLRKDGSQT